MINQLLPSLKFFNSQT